MATNRDEFHERPTARAQFWSDYPDLLAGRDLVQMGTWLGITKTGRFAALTNYRGQRHNKKRQVPSEYKSRGTLVTDFLNGLESPLAYLKRIAPTSHLYQGFNLLVGDVSNLYYFSQKNQTTLEVPPGIHGLSNNDFNVPWPKVEKGKCRLQEIITNTNVIHPDPLFEMLTNTELGSDHALPSTGVGREMERLLSPIFIKGNEYGTRSSTVLTIDHKHHVSFYERCYDQRQSNNIVTQHNKLIKNEDSSFHFQLPID